MAASRLSTVRWGILGVGDVCEVKAGPALYKAQGSKLVAVMRRTASKAEDFAKRHGVPRWYTDADELLSDPEVNAVYIATPPRNHLVSAGAGHVHSSPLTSDTRSSIVRKGGRLLTAQTIPLRSILGMLLFRAALFTCMNASKHF